ncbi:hypothetical protein [Streptomyces sp. NPDC004546]|uniref:hypothetical protein n=1 Tax=Streptomyces sp. NPDC004546 TaxID=3154282 RepID=UPI0033BC1008
MAEVRIMGATVEEEEQVAELIRLALAAYPVPVAVDAPRRLPNRQTTPGTPEYRIVLTVIPGAPPNGQAQHTVQAERGEHAHGRGETRGNRVVAGRRGRPALPPGGG